MESNNLNLSYEQLIKLVEEAKKHQTLDILHPNSISLWNSLSTSGSK